MWPTVAASLLLCYAPGALVLRAPMGSRLRRESLDAEERVFWGVVLSVVITSVVALTLGLLGRYRFDRLLLIDGAACLAMIATWRGRLRYSSSSTTPTWSAVLPLALLGLGVWLYFPPAEYVIGGKDPGTYMSEGLQLAQRGTLIAHDPIVSMVPTALRDLFFPSYVNPTYYGVRFMGFFILDPAAGTVVGQFPHLFPAWIAVGYGLNGLSGARQAVAVWALLAAVAVYFAGARLFGKTVAFAGTSLLVLNVVQLWFAKYPNAEIPMQALVFAGLLAHARAEVDDDRFFGPVAAALFGLILFLKPIDGLLLLAALGVAHALIWWREGRPPSRGFVWPLVAWMLVAGAYLVLALPPYAQYPIDFVRNLAWWHWLGLIVGGGVAGGVLVVAKRRAGVRDIDDVVPQGLAVGVVVLAAYAYFVRQAGGRTAEHDAMALRSFAWYVGPVGLAAAVMGYAYSIRDRFWRSPLFYIIVATFGVVFFYKIRIVPEHFWMTRRFLPVVLPGATLLIAATALAGRETWRWRQPGENSRPWSAIRLVIPAALLGLIGASFVAASRPLVHYVEYAGVIPQLERLASRFTDRDLLIVESRNSSDLHVLGLPLAYIYAKNLLVLSSPRPDRVAFKEFLEWTKSRFEHVYFLGGGGTDLLSRSIGVEAVDSQRFQITEYDSPRNAYPRSVRHKEFDFGLYKFIDSSSRRGGFTLDIGSMDDLNVVRTHAKERDAANDITYRWMRDTSYIALDGFSPELRTLTLVMNDGGRPARVARAQVDVSLNDRPLGRVEVTTGFSPYSFAIPAELAAAAAASDEPARIKLVTNAWKPLEILATPDSRDLGVMVDRVEVR